MCWFWCLSLRVVCRQESPAVLLSRFQTPANEFLLYSQTDQRSRQWMGSLKDTGLFLYMYSLRWRRLSLLFSYGFCLSLYRYECSLPHFLPTPPLPIPSPCLPLSPALSFPWPTVLFLATLFTLWNRKQTQRPGCSTDESSACLLMTVCFWFVCCRLKTETGNSRRSWSWLSRSCSRPFARQRLCLRWKQSSPRG